jgi:hypothetical protein
MDMYEQAYYYANCTMVKHKLECWYCGKKTNNRNGGPEGQSVCDKCREEYTSY